MRHRISSGLLAEIVTRCERSPQAEVCGLLLGAERIERVLHAANVAADPTRTFEVDPALLLAAHREARAGGWPVLGHYHSHPGGRAWPSAADAAASTPGQLWLIVAGAEVRLFRAEPGARFTPLELAVG